MSQAPLVNATRAALEPEISLGRELRRAREVRGISIEQIAQETKINERYLLALEADRLDLLPGQLYARNFVRSVARTIGADEEELLDYFNYQVRMTQDVGSARDDSGTGPAGRRGLVVAVVVVAAVVLIAALTMLLRDKPPATESAGGSARPSRRGQSPPPSSIPTPPGQQLPEDPAASGATSSAPAGTAARSVRPGLPGAAPATSPTEPAPQTAAAVVPTPVAAGASVSESAVTAPTLRLAFTDASWVEIQREGESEPVVGMKAKGAVMTYTLDRPVTITILNSAGASLSVDGQPFRALGGPQEKRTLTIDSKNFQQYLKK